MTTPKLVWKEMLSSPGSTGALLLAVALSVATAVAVVATTRALTDEMRRVTKAMGNNVVVLPPGSEIEDFTVHANDRHRMDEAEWRRLGTAAWPALAIRHVVPELRGTLEEGSLRVIGVGPEIDMGRELAPPIPRGRVAVGSEAARRLKVSAGDELKLGKLTLTVKSVAEPAGSPDDAAVTMHLADAQELLGAGGRITSITALACKCAGRFLTDAQQRTQAAMPAAKVITKMPIARARVKARNSVERFGGMLTIAAAVLGAMVVMLALWGNVSGRMEELGTLLAIGARPLWLASVVSWKVVVLAGAGAVGGWALGTLAAARAAPAFAAMMIRFDPDLLGVAVVLALAVAGAGSIAPLVRILLVDAAQIIREA